MAFDWDEMALVGRILRPHGRAGQVLVDPETDFPEARFAPGRAVYTRRPGGVTRLEVVRARPHQGRLLVRFDGVEAFEDAAALAGAELRVPVAELTPLPPGTYYRHELVDCEVRTRGGEVLGRVTAVEGPLEGSCLVVRGPRGEVLVPLAEPICVAIEVDRRLIIVDVPDDLLELNAPPRRTRS